MVAKIRSVVITYTDSSKRKLTQAEIDRRGWGKPVLDKHSRFRLLGKKSEGHFKVGKVVDGKKIGGLARRGETHDETVKRVLGVYLGEVEFHRAKGSKIGAISSTANKLHVTRKAISDFLKKYNL